MKIFKRKKNSPQHELLETIRFGSYIETPDDFDADAWANANDSYFFQITFRHKAKQFIGYLFNKIKSKLPWLRTSNLEQHSNDEEFDDAEFILTFQRGLEIVEEFDNQFRTFAEQLMDTNRAEIEYMNKRIVYYRKDHPTNKGFARYIEDLDHSNRFEYGWGSENGTREQNIDSIMSYLGFECAQVENGSL
jgi:hypothetical protein